MKRNGHEQVLAMHRFGFGASQHDLLATGTNPRDAVLQQLALVQPVFMDKLPKATDHLARIAHYRAAPAHSKEQLITQLRTDMRGDSDQLFLRRTEMAVESHTPFVERLVHFWSNHFAVSGKKSFLGPAAAGFEFEVIRPHVLGSFTDMLLAAVSHPVMLIYLDNTTSMGAHSTAAINGVNNGKRRYGINENLAREILELHSLGVRSGYKQQDVVELSKALTGWTVSDLRGAYASSPPGVFRFIDELHEPGERKFLGKRYPEAGQEQARMMLQDLATHPHTAAHIAGKLCTHFVADHPPPELVSLVTQAYLSSGGNLAETSMELLLSNLAWQPPLKKMKTPEQFILSSLRTLGVLTFDINYLRESLTAMGQPPDYVPSPAGWPDEADTFSGGAGILRRIEFAHNLGTDTGGHEPTELYRQSFGPMAEKNAINEIAHAESIAQGIALFLLSSGFQRR